MHARMQGGKIPPQSIQKVMFTVLYVCILYSQSRGQNKIFGKKSEDNRSYSSLDPVILLEAEEPTPDRWKKLVVLVALLGDMFNVEDLEMLKTAKLLQVKAF